MTDAAAFWDRAAATFDDEPDHGLLGPDIRDAWRRLLVSHLPAAPARVADIGCGTGTLAVLLAAEGYEVSGVDLSSQMLARARVKADDAGVTVGLARGDAAHPPLASRTFDAIVCRHVLWAVDDISGTLATWTQLLAPSGVLLLIEGEWCTGAGVASAALVQALERLGRGAHVEQLPDERLWAGPIDDERYLVVSPA